MANERSASNGPEPKATFVSKLVDHVLDTYGRDRPYILWWRNLMDEYYECRGEVNPIYGWRTKPVHRHLVAFIGHIKAEFRRRGFDVVAVAQLADNALKHGRRPDVNGKLNDEYYKQCIPNSAWPSMGIGVFPRGSDWHPLVFHSRTREMTRSGSRLVSSVRNSDHSEAIGTVRPDQNKQIKSNVEEKCARVFHPYPLLESGPEKTESLEPGTPSRGRDSGQKKALKPLA